MDILPHGVIDASTGLASRKLNECLPKNIFLIWFGDQRPILIDEVVAQYKKMNPRWNVEFIWRTKNDVMYSHDHIMSRCRGYIMQVANRTGSNEHSERIKCEIEQKLNYIQILSDIYRFELLRERGGIYVDCDTWPLKSFDDMGIDGRGFNSLVVGEFKFKPDGTWKDTELADGDSETFFHFCNDIYCFGLPRGFDSDSVEFKQTCLFKNPTKVVWDRHLEQKDWFKKMSKDFHSGIVPNMTKEISRQLGNMAGILHFRKGTWRLPVEESPMLCPMDNKLHSISNNRANTSIERNLLFVWIGDELPIYAHNCMNAYKRMNPTFNVVLKHFTVHDVEHPEDPLLRKVVDAILEVKDGLRNKHYDFIKRYLDEGRRFCQVVANLLRFVALEEMGGIYLDMDTLPMRPFDDQLLASGSFNSICTGWRDRKLWNELHKDGKELYPEVWDVDSCQFFRFPDIFMIGHAKNIFSFEYTQYVGMQNNYNTGEYLRNQFLHDPTFLAMRGKFLRGKLKECQYDGSGKYIAHFFDGTWMSDEEHPVIRTPKCKYDLQETLEIPRWL